MQREKGRSSYQWKFWHNLLAASLTLLFSRTNDVWYYWSSTSTINLIFDILLSIFDVFIHFEAQQTWLTILGTKKTDWEFCNHKMMSKVVVTQDFELIKVSTDTATVVIWSHTVFAKLNSQSERFLSPLCSAVDSTCSLGQKATNNWL